MTKLFFDPPVIAHRGASAYAPENTIAAFTKAAQLGVKWVEFDVMQSQCGEPIIFHDETLERTSDGKGSVIDYPYEYLQTLDAGKWYAPTFSGECIPTLTQTLSFLESMGLNANVEIKALPAYEKRQVERVVELVTPYLNKNKITLLFSSFSWDALMLLREFMPNCLLGLLLHEWEKNWEAMAQELECVSIHVNERIMTAKAASKIKAMGKYLLCYTVNDAKRAKVLFNWGVDAVFSDVPDQIMNIPN